MNLVIGEEHSQPRSFPDGRGVGRPATPWPWCALLVGSALYLGLFWQMPISDPDEGLIVTGAERILRGQVPYRDFFSELAPGSFYLQAGIFRIAGVSLFSLRLTVWLVGIAMSVVVYSLSRKIIRGWWALAPVVIFLTICYPLTYRLSHHWWGNLLYLLMVLCLATLPARLHSAPALRRRLPLLAGGLFAALTALCMQSKGAWALLAAGAFLLVGAKLLVACAWRETLRKGLICTLWFLLGFGVPATFSVIYFWMKGAMGEWVFDNLVFLFAHYRPYLRVPQATLGGQLVNAGSALFEEPSLGLLIYFVGYAFFAVAGPLAAFGSATWRLCLRRDADGSLAKPLLVYLLAGLGILLSEWHSPDIFHLMWASPLMLILLCAAGQWAWEQWRPSRRFLGGICALALMFVVLGSLRNVGSAARLEYPVITRRGTLFARPELGPALQQRIRAIEEAVPPGGEAFFFPYDPHFYFLTATRNPTRYDVLLPGFNSAQQVGEVLAALRERLPERVFSLRQLEHWSIRPHFYDDVPDVFGPHPVETYLRSPQSSYRLAAEVTGLEVWTRKP